MAQRQGLAPFYQRHNLIPTMVAIIAFTAERRMFVPRFKITTHAFEMVDFRSATKDFEKRLSLEKPIFHYSETQVAMFYKNPKKRARKTKRILLRGFYGASWFDFQIQLARFLPKDAQIIDITISYGNSSLLVVFLPRVFTPKIGKNHHCPLLTVDIKTGEIFSEHIRFRPSTYNPPIEETKDFLF